MEETVVIGRGIGLRQSRDHALALRAARIGAKGSVHGAGADGGDAQENGVHAILVRYGGRFVEQVPDGLDHAGGYIRDAQFIDLLIRDPQ